MQIAVMRVRLPLFLFLLALCAMAMVPLALFHANLDKTDATQRRSSKVSIPPTHNPDSRAGPGSAERQRNMQEHAVLDDDELLPSNFGVLDKQQAAAATTTTKPQQTNRTPLALPVRGAFIPEPPPVPAANLSVSDHQKLPPPVEEPVKMAQQQQKEQGLAAPQKPEPVQEPALVAPQNAPPMPTTAQVNTDCDGHARTTLWDDDPTHTQQATSPSGETCSVHSESLNAVFHQRFEFAPGSLQLGGHFDSEQCYTYVGRECWEIHERSPSLPCPTSILDKPALDDDSLPPDVLPARQPLLSMLRRATILGRLGATEIAGPAQKSADTDNSAAFGGGGLAARFGVGGGASFLQETAGANWRRQALDVAVSVAEAAEWDAVSVLLHGDSLGDMVAAAAEELPSALVMYSAVTPAALDQHITRSETEAQVLNYTRSTRVQILTRKALLAGGRPASPRRACPRHSVYLLC